MSRAEQLLCCAQVIDPHTHQYLDRLKDEPLFLALAQKVSDHLARTGDTKALARVALRRIEHFYYKTDAVYGAMRKLALQQKEAANAVQVRARDLICKINIMYNAMRKLALSRGPDACAAAGGERLARGGVLCMPCACDGCAANCADISASCRELMRRHFTGVIVSPPDVMFLCFQEEADTGDEIPDEDEEVVVSKENVVVTVPADFTLSESCQELMNQLAATIYRWGSRSQTSTASAAWGGNQASVTRCISRACVSVIGYVLSWAPAACSEG